MRLKLPGILLTLPAVAAAFLAASPARAQDRDDYGDIHQTVARISYVNGDVSYARGDDPDGWQAADRNVPMTLGDRLYTGSKSRIELQVHGGDVVRLGARTDFGALNLTDETKQFSMQAGVASFQIRNLSDSEVWEVDTPNSAVTFEAPGDYRIDVDTNGDTRVFVRQGRAAVAAGGGQVPVERGEAMQVYGIDRPQYDYMRVSGPDSWDQWVSQRESRFANARSYRYISADIVGADDLDESGRWEQVPQYGWAWTPTVIAADWAPYRAGHWIWQDPWGWTWVSTESWGWAPYHYGRWVVASSRWYWIPVAPAVRYVTYSPALVAFSGGGPGWSMTVSSGVGGFIGWFPLGPRDPFNPWWGYRSGVRVATVPNVTYVNRNYITVVNRSAFVSGTPVARAWVRDRAVVTQVESAPILRGPIPAVPNAGAMRVGITAESRAVLRPPANVSRSVVVRAAPPPAPPTFQAKLAVITRNQGAPIEPTAAARISVENRGRPQTVTEVKPVVAQSGQVTLAQRSSQGAETTRRPEPVAAVPFRGRQLATAQQPVSASSGPSPGQPSREVNTRQVPPQAPPGQVETGQERRRVERAPAVAPENAQQPANAGPPSGERGRPQSQEFRQRVEPTQPPAAAMERQRIEQQQKQQQDLQNQQRAAERQRIEQQQKQQQDLQNQQRAADRQKIEQQQKLQQDLENHQRAIERQRIEQQQKQQQQPPPQPPQGSERRRMQQPTPAPDNPRENVQRGREAPPPPQQQKQAQPPPPPQQQQQQQQPPPQAQRGRAATPQEGQQGKDKDKGKENKDQKKEERGRQPTPTS
jgi:hypothetical protein